MEKELTILMPCLNEEKTLQTCINKANKFLEKNNINGEILIVDNGSKDKSINIAKKNKVRLVYEKTQGYGSSLITGLKNTQTKYVIMGDSDDSYNFLEIMPILEKLRQGYDLVIGNRYKGKIEKGAMKFSHKYIGTPIISTIARKKYNIKIGDFNCGLRGYNTKKMKEINCKSLGMEYASEMIIKARKNNLKMCEVPVNLYKDGRGEKSHLNTIKDGIRHMKIIFKCKKDNI